MYICMGVYAYEFKCLCRTEQDDRSSGWGVSGSRKLLNDSAWN